MSGEERFGFHRVVGGGTTPQAAERLDAETKARENESELEVMLLNLDATSARQLGREAERQGCGVAALVLDIVRQRGKMHNPVTNSGGVLVGRLRRLGRQRSSRGAPPPLGCLVVPLCSLTAIPLRLDSVSRVQGNQVHCRGTAIVYDSLVLAQLPDPHPWLGLEALLAAVDVSRLVPQLTRTLRAARPRVVACLGCGHSGMLALALCSELVPDALLIALDVSDANLAAVASLGLPRLRTVKADATRAVDVFRAVRGLAPDGADLVLNLVSVPNTEAGTALAAAAGGTIIYFSMSVDFTRAVLSTDVTGAPLNVHVGAGVFADQATATLALLERHPRLAALMAPHPAKL